MSGKMTDYPRCKTCRHWDDRGRRDSAMCECKNSNVLAGDGIDEACSETGCFYTGPDFGCVHHESKESE